MPTLKESMWHICMKLAMVRFHARRASAEHHRASPAEGFRPLSLLSMRTATQQLLLSTHLHGWQATSQVHPRWMNHIAFCFDNHSAGPTNVRQQQGTEVVDDPGLIAANRFPQQRSQETRDNLLCYSSQTTFAGSIKSVAVCVPGNFYPSQWVCCD